MKTKVWIALLALYIVWGSTYLAIRFSVETIPPFLHAALRFLVSGAILYAWRRAAGDPAPTLSNWKSTAIVGAALLLGGNGLVAWAEQTVPSGIAALMISTSPFWLVLFESLRSGGAKPTWQAILGLIVGFVGVFILIGPTEITGTGVSYNTFGIILLLFAPFFWSLGSIYAKGADFNTAPNQFLVDVTSTLPAGRALDVGMGMGRNALHLARKGWDVTGFDVSAVGVQHAQAAAKALLILFSSRCRLRRTSPLTFRPSSRLRGCTASR